MNPILHAEVLGVAAPTSLRTRGGVVVTRAGVLPDLDGVGG